VEDWKQGISRKSIVVHRYYDAASTILGEGKTPPITDFASPTRRRTMALTWGAVELKPAPDDQTPWRVRYDWQQDNKPPADWKDLDINEWRSGTLSIPIPFTRDKIPGARGRLRFVARPWNVCTRSQRPAHWHGPSSRRASRRV